MPSPTHAIWPTLPPHSPTTSFSPSRKANKKLYRTALEVMAPRMGIRVPILLEMPKAQRHATWIQILARPEMEVLSFNLLSTWLIETSARCFARGSTPSASSTARTAAPTLSRPSPTPRCSRRASMLLLEKFDPGHRQRLPAHLQPDRRDPVARAGRNSARATQRAAGRSAPKRVAQRSDLRRRTH